MNAKRQPYGTINVSRPLERVLGAGGGDRSGTRRPARFGRRWRTLTAYDLAPEFLGVAPVNLTTNLPDSDSEYYTWEITATKRQSGRWSLLASFTRDLESRGGAWDGQRFHAERARSTPTGGQDRFTTWQAKVNGTINLPWGFGSCRSFAISPARRSRARSCARSTTATRRSKRSRSRPIGPRHHARRCADREDVPRQGRARDGILRRLQHLQHQRRADADDQLGGLLAAADGDHRTSHPPDRRPIGLVVMATTLKSVAMSS